MLLLIIPIIEFELLLVQMILVVIPLSVQALFYLLAKIIADNYKILQKQAEELRSQCAFLTAEQMALKLRRWKFSYLKVYESVRLLNRLFGIIFLFEIVYLSISIIINSFFLISKKFFFFPLDFKVNRVAFFIENLINVLAVCFLSERITKEVQ